jgi:hypothetical protein
MGDVEDPEIYAAQPLYEWQNTEQGQWVMEHAVEPPVYMIRPDPAYFGHLITVDARLNEEDTTYFCLRWQ